MVFMALLSRFFFNEPTTTVMYTLSLHDALPILGREVRLERRQTIDRQRHRALAQAHAAQKIADRKSTRLNSSHGYISYAVFCLKKKTRNTTRQRYHATILLTNHPVTLKIPHHLF